VIRFSKSFLGMIHVLKSMRRSTTTGQTCRKLSMPIPLKSPTNGLHAGDFNWFIYHLNTQRKYVTNHNESKTDILLCMSSSYSDVLNRNWNDTEASVLPTYRQLMAARLRIWVFRLANFELF